MSLWEKKYLPQYEEFVKDIINWSPDYIVPVARKSCKLFHAVDNLFQQIKGKVYYRDYFETFSSDDIENKKIAVVDDAVQHGSTLYEYRMFFEGKRSIVQTFGFIGHQLLQKSKNENYDPKAIIKIYLPEAAYQEYLLLQSSHLIMNGAHQDLDHLVVEIDMEKAESQLVDNLIVLLRSFGYVYELPPEYEGVIKRFGIHQPDFFTIKDFLPENSVTGDFVQKIKFSFLQKKKRLLCALMVFPKMLCNAPCPCDKDSPYSLLLPCKKFPGICKEQRVNKFCYQFTSLFLSTVLGKQFMLALKHVDKEMLTLFGNFEIKKADLVRYLGEEIGTDLAHQISNFIKSYESTENIILKSPNNSLFSNSISPRPSFSYENVTLLLKRLREGYEEEVKKRGRVGTHYTLSIEDLLKINGGIHPLVLTEILDEKCDVGILVPAIEKKNGWWRRTYRTGEPTGLQWKRTTYLIPWVVENIKPQRAGAMEVMKCLANFDYDFPRLKEDNKELHCFISKPSHWGTEVFVENREKRKSEIPLNKTEEIGGRYGIDRDGYYFILPVSLEGIDNIFDDDCQIKKSFINDYIKYLVHLKRTFGKVDILNALSICRHFETWYSRIWFNISKWTDYYNRFLNKKFRSLLYTENPQFGPLHLSNTEAVSGMDKIGYAESFPAWFENLKILAEKDLIGSSHIFNWISKKTYTIDEPISSKDEFKKVKIITNAQIALSSLSLLKLNLYKEENVEKARNKILELAPRGFKDADIELNPAEFLQTNLNYRQISDIFKETYSKILVLFKGLREPLPDPERVVMEDYYRRLGKTKAIDVVRKKVQESEWQYVVVVQADLCRYSDHGGFASYACGILKQYFEQFCKQYKGEFINPDAGDAFVGLFGSYEAVQFTIALRTYLKNNYDQGTYFPKTVRAKLGIGFTEFPNGFSEQALIRAMGVSADCCNLGKSEAEGYRNEGDIVTNGSFVDFLKAKGIGNLNIKRIRDDRKIRRSNQKEEVYLIES